MGTINRTTAELNKQLQPAHMYLNLSQAEPIIGDSTWRSPETYVQIIEPLPENFDYIGGSGDYIGVEDKEIMLTSSVTFKTTTANTSIFLTGGVDGVPNEAYQVKSVLTNANDEKLLVCHFPADIVTGNNIDFFVKADKDVTLEYATFSIEGSS